MDNPEEQWKIKQKHNTMCVGHHYAQTDTNNVIKTWALLQTTEGKDDRILVLSFPFFFFPFYLFFFLFLCVVFRLFFFFFSFVLFFIVLFFVFLLLFLFVCIWLIFLPFNIALLYVHSNLQYSAVVVVWNIGKPFSSGVYDTKMLALQNIITMLDIYKMHRYQFSSLLTPCAYNIV